VCQLLLGQRRDVQTHKLATKRRPQGQKLPKPSFNIDGLSFDLACYRIQKSALFEHGGFDREVGYLLKLELILNNEAARVRVVEARVDVRVLQAFSPDDGCLNRFR
jgi:hypothetical protein